MKDRDHFSIVFLSICLFIRLSLCPSKLLVQTSTQKLLKQFYQNFTGMISIKSSCASSSAFPRSMIFVSYFFSFLRPQLGYPVYSPRNRYERVGVIPHIPYIIYTCISHCNIYKQNIIIYLKFYHINIIIKAYK
jgi:hypothetical protein